MPNHLYPSYADIDLENFSDNMRQFLSLLEDSTSLLAVLKADGYGHGAVKLAQYLQQQGLAQYIGVAQLAEALDIRAAGVHLPMMTFSFPTSESVALAIQHEITIPIFCKDHIDQIVKASKTVGKKAIVHLKIDSGMGRIGVRSIEEVVELFEMVKNHLDFIELEGIFTHFAEGEDTSENNYTDQQFAFFKECYQAIEDTGFQFKLKHCCNTAGTLLRPAYHLDMVRVGIGLYGYLPEEDMHDLIQLKPIMTIKSTVTNIKQVETGHTIGYGRSYTAKKHTDIATIAIGYADGIDRKLSNQGHFVYQDIELPIVGRVCMDQLMLDISNIAEVIKVNETVTFIGNHFDQPSLMSIYEIAELTGRFHYEILCLIGRRVKRIYHEERN